MSNLQMSQSIATSLNLPVSGVGAVVRLLGEQATVPFIARYRKEMTGSLDEVQIRAIQEKHTYLTELYERRDTVLESIRSQGKLTPALEAKIKGCETKQALEDLYLPYKPKRRTRATIAKEKGLEPLADRLWAQPLEGDPAAEAEAFVKLTGDKATEVADVRAALRGARDIVAERIAETAEVRALVRDRMAKRGQVETEKSSRAPEGRTKFEDYYEYDEPLASIPSHRFLAVRRGEKEGVLRVAFRLEDESLPTDIGGMVGLDKASPFAREMSKTIDDTLARLVLPSVETDLRVELKMRSDTEAVDVFANNLRALLLAAPLGAQPVLGIDPGLRTGCKVVILAATGKFEENTTLFLTQGTARMEQAKHELVALIAKHQPRAIAVGNGTGGRETERFVRKTLKECGFKNPPVVVQVNEAGASVYSASDVAREEFPELDLTVRGAISIGRRLQDPLAELVKIEPKAIGVGQYQHDVFQPMLVRKLGEVVESCVNHVGVDLNTASAPLLSYVAGIGKSVARRIVMHRERNGAFSSRDQLLSVSGMGPKTYEQAAGFLKVHGQNALDASAVHPERYPLVEQMAADLGVAVADLVGSAALAGKIDVKKYATDDVGEPTLRDIVAELKKPGRDPRDAFEPPKFREDVEEMTDLREGMVLEGVVTNVTNFGAFVDIGVHQDGLVHISALSDRYVSDPHEVVSAGQKLQVRVLEVDLQRKRIALTARMDGGGRQPGEDRSGGRSAAGGGYGRGESRGGGNQGGQGRGRGGQNRGNAGRGGRGGQNRGGAGRGGAGQSGGGFTNNPFAGLLKR